MKKDNHMENKKKLRNEVIKGELMLGFGIILIVVGLITFNLPQIIPYQSLIQGIGLFLVVVGLWNLIQHFRYLKNPEAQKKARVENMDERKLWIQARSGNNAFKFGITTTYLALLFTGATPEAISSDLAWWALAGIVVGTLIVYIISLVRYEQMY
jgi:TctA family transporter